MAQSKKVKRIGFIICYILILANFIFLGLGAQEFNDQVNPKRAIPVGFVIAFAVSALLLVKLNVRILSATTKPTKVEPTKKEA